MDRRAAARAVFRTHRLLPDSKQDAASGIVIQPVYKPVDRQHLSAAIQRFGRIITLKRRPDHLDDIPRVDAPADKMDRASDAVEGPVVKGEKVAMVAFIIGQETAVDVEHRAVTERQIRGAMIDVLITTTASGWTSSSVSAVLLSLIQLTS